jgi:hypothetical protein
MIKLLYKPLGVAFSCWAALAGAIFKRLWKLLAWPGERRRLLMPTMAGSNSHRRGTMLGLVKSRCGPQRCRGRRSWPGY